MWSSLQTMRQKQYTNVAAVCLHNTTQGKNIVCTRIKDDLCKIITQPPAFQRKKDKQSLSYVQVNMVRTHACIYLRYEVLELVNYDHSQSFNGTRCLPLLRITSQQTIILVTLTSRSEILKVVIINNAVI